ncbi:hypothetical protein GCM10010378_35400 [Streptomyces viridochromogenes]
MACLPRPSPSPLRVSSGFAPDSLAPEKGRDQPREAIKSGLGTARSARPRGPRRDTETQVTI